MSHAKTHNHHASTEEKVTFGFWIYLMSDVVLFATLFATYAVLRNQTFGLPRVADLTDIAFVLVETMLLLTSSFTAGLAVYFASKNASKQAFGLLVTTLALGVAFLAMEAYEFRHLIESGHGPWMNAAYSAFFTLVGTHGLHVFIGVIWGTLLAIQSQFWDFKGTVMRRLFIFSLFWHFLDVIWIFIFTFVYLFGVLSL